MTGPTPSSGNVFADLGFDDEEASLLAVKSRLLSALASYTAEFDTQSEAAAALGVSQPRVSEITNGRLSKFTADLLIKLCHRAGVEVRVDTGRPAAA
ncbi:helix-turn-helix transcriptional regulator [Rubrivirga sp. S365]|uniref:Helix-turn-helix transcriptional regulator n=1 Tax=Rubrivirga litoralis TaxID=3075598 RepID=A0ABU3BQV5_9BACT|nr:MULTISPECIES: helix-turn-helix transcriptional regulator [unclassified Rubrivirga]MDT0631662.1 helix-turn-helix transcriptional regulator [Rubrivirga sp. F394]MDT7855595.1 helix-turn-helix transcriptional regulator [Rubrivirga sp. S365]